MLIALHSHLRRQRRRMLVALAVMTVALAALSAHSALMNNPVDDHVMSDTAALCLAVGGSLVIGVAILAVRRLTQRPRWAIPLLSSRVLPSVAVARGLPIRAGPPPPASLQVFRL